jgi:hypothetical protein
MGGEKLGLRRDLHAQNTALQIREALGGHCGASFAEMSRRHHSSEFRIDRDRACFNVSAVAKVACHAQE